jgi:hypothetical protein
MAKIKQVICPRRKQKYFCKWGWTHTLEKRLMICPSGKIGLITSTKHTVILRCALFLRASKDGRTHCAEHHPSRLAEDGEHLRMTVPLEG